MRQSTLNANTHQDDGHYWISISDLMTSLLFIFIIILAYTIYSFTQKSDKFEESFNARSELLVDLQTSLKHKNINVDIDPKNGNMRIKSDAFFAVGSADLNQDGQQAIMQIAQEIKTKMQNKKYQQAIDTIFIEGHTDNVPISINYGRRWTNMELSAQRAINTYLMMDNGVNIKEMVNRDGRYLFSYSGYADTRPISDNDSDVGRAKNRRIELFFALTSPKLE
ncbi:OmpA/MotB family protein [Moraxella oblonga]|uniref:OmpA/MotB family protein n=1 Tax=Moraxella oblonga TaxID=200413 RepID=UPI00082B5853|nr:OmpA family protein [Moraxella oblonga]